MGKTVDQINKQIMYFMRVHVIFIFNTCEHVLTLCMYKYAVVLETTPVGCDLNSLLQQILLYSVNTKTLKELSKRRPLYKLKT